MWNERDDESRNLHRAQCVGHRVRVLFTPEECVCQQQAQRVGFDFGRRRSKRNGGVRRRLLFSQHER